MTMDPSRDSSLNLVEYRIPKYVQPLQLFHDCFGGELCLIVGSGPSSRNLHSLGEKLNWADFFSISVNHSQKKFPSILHFFQDASCYDFFRQHYMRHQTLCVTMMPNQQHFFYQNRLPMGFFVRKHTSWKEGSGYCINRHKDGYWNIDIPVVLSGAHAAVLAWKMGLTPVLVGFDAKGSSYDYGTPHPRMGEKNTHAVKHGRIQYAWLKQNAEKLGWINCSNSDFAPRHDISEVLGATKPNYQAIAGHIQSVFEYNLKQNAPERLVGWSRLLPARVREGN